MFNSGRLSGVEAQKCQFPLAMKQITASEFDVEVRASPLPVLVDFFTDRCEPCRRLAPALEQISQERAGKLKVVKVDAAKEVDLAVRFRVMSVPTLMVFRDGDCVAQRVGGRHKDEILAWIDGV